MGSLVIHTMNKTNTETKIGFGCQYLTMSEDRLEVGQSSRFGTDGLVKEVLVKHLQVELILIYIKQFGNHPSLSFDNLLPSSCAIQLAPR